VVTLRRFLMLLERLVTLQKELTDFEVVWLQGLDKLLAQHGKGKVTATLDTQNPRDP